MVVIEPKSLAQPGHVKILFHGVARREKQWPPQTFRLDRSGGDVGDVQ